MNIDTENSEELNDLKSLWKTQSDAKTYGKDEIFKMIHRKSINSVQWMFIISIAEMLFGLIISVWTLFSGKHLFSDESIRILGQQNIIKLENFAHFGLFFSLIFVGIIFYFYRRISSELSVSDLLKYIINFRRTIIWFLVIGVAILLIFISPIYFEIGQKTYIEEALKEGISMDEINRKSKTIGWIFTLITSFFLLLSIFIYYLIIYGFFLRRLKKNKKELQKINS